MSVGDTLIIEPEIVFDLETKVGLKYEWSVELDSVFSREKNIEYIIPLMLGADEMGVAGN